MSAPIQPSKVCKGKKPKFMPVPSMKLPVTLFPKVYQSVEEMEKAKRNGTFDLKKTMCLKNGRLYFLCTQ